MDMKRYLISVAYLSLGPCYSTLAYSEEPVNITSGMSMSEVLKALGPAETVEEFEPSRKVVFNYPHRAVTFYQGKVRLPKQMTTDIESGSRKPDLIDLKEPPKAKEIYHEPRPEEVDKLLREIMKESTADSGTTPGSPTGTGSTGLPNPNVPNMGQPLIMPPPVMDRE
jgi:hypothetical protein